MKPARHRLAALLLPALLLTAGPVAAERTYKWVDAQGNIHYGDRVPMQAKARQRQEINEQGRTVKEFHQKTAEELAEQRRRAALEQQQQQHSRAQEDQDSELLAAYKSEADLLAVRDSEVDSRKELIRMTRIRLESLQQRLADFTAEAADYEQRGKPVPEFVQHQMKQLRGQIARNEDIITAKQAELERIEATYAADIARYQELQSRNPTPR